MAGLAGVAGSAGAAKLTALKAKIVNATTKVCIVFIFSPPFDPVRRGPGNFLQTFVLISNFLIMSAPVA
jgi:hypothetical protein